MSGSPIIQTILVRSPFYHHRDDDDDDDESLDDDDELELGDHQHHHVVLVHLMIMTVSSVIQDQPSDGNEDAGFLSRCCDDDNVVSDGEQ